MSAPDPLFRERLKAELVRRTHVNPRYSLRAFARSLNIHPATLSLFLSGKRGMSQKLRLLLALKLGWLKDKGDDAHHIP